MKKYVVIDMKVTNSETNVSAFNMLVEANKHASYTWNHLTENERKNRIVEVGCVTEADLQDFAIEDNVIDWTLIKSWEAINFKGC